MKISELFTSIQGEGNYSGIPTIFIRFFGCPLRCTWCDSQYTWDNKVGRRRYTEYTEQELLKYSLQRPNVRLVCITGGEPLADYNRSDLFNLVKRLAIRKSISVETSGCFVLPEWRELVTSWVWDVKLPGSGEWESNLLDELVKLESKDQVKFVIKDLDDLEVAIKVYKDYKLEQISGLTILWSPVYNSFIDIESVQAHRDLLERIAKTVIRLGGSNRISLQVHKQIWGEKRGY